MTTKQDAVKLLKISNVIMEGFVDYEVSDLTVQDLHDITEAQLKIAYELGKASK